MHDGWRQRTVQLPETQDPVLSESIEAWVRDSQGPMTARSQVGDHLDLDCIPLHSCEYVFPVCLLSRIVKSASVDYPRKSFPRPQCAG